MAVQTSVITEAQRLHFQTFGYVVFHQLFQPDEIERHAREIERILREQRGGTDFDGQKRETVAFLDRHPDVFGQLFDDDRIIGVVDGLLGEDSLYMGCDANLYVGNTRWHADSTGMYGLQTMKTAFYCDPVAEGNGCLSVIPRSHHQDFAYDILRLAREGVLDLASPDIPGRTPIASMPGDVVAFDHRLWHSSWGGNNHRRMFTMNWATYPRNEWDEDLLVRWFSPKTASYYRNKTAKLAELPGLRHRDKITRLGALRP